jgi:hypothetical protein
MEKAAKIFPSQFQVFSGGRSKIISAALSHSSERKTGEKKSTARFDLTDLLNGPKLISLDFVI